MIDDHQTWHLDRRVPVGIIIAIIIQTIGILIWATKLDSRVGVLETADNKQEARIQKLEDIGSRIAVIEDRQINTITRLDIQTKTMQEILSIVGKIPAYGEPRQK